MAARLSYLGVTPKHIDSDSRIFRLPDTGANHAPSPGGPLNVLIVVETAFGNTRTVAERITERLNGAGAQVRVELVTVADTPERIPEDTDLLLVGAPTHDFTMSEPGTRAQATDKGATEVGAEGVREWIGRLEPRGGLRAALSTPPSNSG